MQIHQFHSGTAVGDAITNEMLAIRAALERAGYESHIYAEHIDPALRDRISTIDGYQPNPDNVLLVHHSMGFDCFDRIVSLPDHKILVYHNITPGAFFVGNPHLAAYAERGREQLRAYREHAAFAFADSEFNERELRDLGFAKTAVLPVTFGLDDLLRVPPTQEILSRSSGPMNVLFVGRIAPNKRQDDLVRMLAHYRRRFDPRARLTLVGDYDRTDPFYRELLRVIAEHDVDGDVMLTGKVSDADLVAYYRSASVYVSMSEHEGFGVPLVEAMTFDVPVVAFDAGAVSYTMGGSGLVFRQKRLPMVAALVREVVQDVGLRRKVLDAQRARVDALRPGGFLQRLLAIVGDVTGRQDGASSGDSLRIQIQGPFETSYSLAIVNRALARGLSQIAGTDVTLHPTEGPGDYTPRAEDLVDKPDLEAMWHRDATRRPADVVIRNVYPPRVRDLDPRQTNLLNFAWEDSLIPSEWADDFNRFLDGVLTPSHHVRSVLRNSGVAIPIEVIGNVVERPANSDEDAAPFTTAKAFRFLHISSGFPRKGCDVLLRAFTTEFSASDDVALIVKTFPNIHNDVGDQVTELRRTVPNCPEIVHIDEDLPPSAMAALYRSASCLVQPTRAEGFGLPVAEAMLARVPVITTGYGGSTDFCRDDTAILLDYRLVPSESHLGVEGAEWAEPDEGQLRRHMRRMVEDRCSRAVQRRVDAGFETIRRDYSQDRVAGRALETIARLRTPRARPLHIAMVSTWNTRCGIAEYAQNLVAATPPMDARWTVVAAEGEPLSPDSPNVARCWRDRWHGDLSRAIDVIEQADADVVHFQFNFGFFELHDLARAIRLLKQSRRAVILTLHATSDATIDGRVVSLGEIAPALRDADCIFVHTHDDRRRLASLGVRGNVARSPHPYTPYPDRDRCDVRRSLGISRAPIIAMFGFALPHKGLMETIEALALLRERYPDVLLLALTALHPDARSRAYHEICQERVRALGLDRHCAIISEYLEARQILAGLQASDVVVLPYHESAESASGAVRLPLASSRPVLTTRQRIFADVADLVYQIDDASPTGIADGIVTILENPDLGGEIVERASERVRHDSWQAVAATQLKIANGICRKRPGDSRDRSVDRPQHTFAA